MGSDLAGRFAEDGFFTTERVVDGDDCAAALQETIQAFRSPAWSFVHEADRRIHAPLPITPLLHRLIRTVIAPAYDVIDDFLQGEKLLAELSSITVFPGARAQPVHWDERVPGKHLLSVFVNLVATARGVGALEVMPGSHRDAVDRPPRPLELPAGSAVFMNGKLKHRGTENSSPDRVRPVVYFSFGDIDIAGPVYSIRPEVARRFQLGDFASRRLEPSSIPRFTGGYWLAVAPATGSLPRRLVAIDGDRLTAAFELDDGDPLAELAALVARGTMSVGAIAAAIAIDERELRDMLEELRGEGLVTW